MGRFDEITSYIENRGWRVLLSNMEDGYIAYANDDYPGYELIFANWDVMGESEELRFVYASHQGGMDGFGTLASTNGFDNLNERGLDTVMVGFLDDVVPDVARNS